MYFIGTSIILNNEILPLAEQLPIGQSGEIYELFRVEDGKALFLDDHLQRFHDCLERNDRILLVDFDKLRSLVSWLLVCNPQRNCNVRMSLSAENILQVGFIPSEFPSENMYAEGVRCDFLSATRTNPNDKIYHPDMRKFAEKQQHTLDIYESLLVDKDNNITEGSRSNIFFVKDKQLFTAPDEMVLGGIMRKKVLEISEKRQIFVNFVPVKSTEIFKYESAFLTSTPMRVLPIKRIGKINYDVDNQLVRAIINDIQLQINDLFICTV